MPNPPDEPGAGLPFQPEQAASTVCPLRVDDGETLRPGGGRTRSRTITPPCHLAPPAPTPQEVVHALIAISRLRLRDAALFDEFFAAAVQATEQATASDGNSARTSWPTRTTSTGRAPRWRDRAGRPRVRRRRARTSRSKRASTSGVTRRRSSTGGGERGAAQLADRVEHLVGGRHGRSTAEPVTGERDARLPRAGRRHVVARASDECLGAPPVLSGDRRRCLGMRGAGPERTGAAPGRRVARPGARHHGGSQRTSTYVLADRPAPSG